ncbi:hypothetical protein HN51_009332 [Arachis hypogaea]
MAMTTCSGYIIICAFLHEQKKKNHASVIIAVTVSAVGTIGILICAFILWKRTAIGERANFRIPTISKTKYPSKVKLPELSQFEFEKLAIATNNFHLANKLAQGGFGLVYRVCFCLQVLVEMLMCATVFSLAVLQKVIGH